LNVGGQASADMTTREWSPAPPSPDAQPESVVRLDEVAGLKHGFDARYLGFGGGETGAGGARVPMRLTRCCSV
jgi:hypothetical protein